jgi:flagellar assembly protein FliH
MPRPAAGARALGLLLDGRRRPFQAGRAPAGVAAGRSGEDAPAGAGFTARPLAGLPLVDPGRAWQPSAQPGSPGAPGATTAPAAPAAQRREGLPPGADDGPGDPLVAEAAAGSGGEAEARLSQARADGFAAGLVAGRQQAEAALGASLEEVAALARALAQARRVDPEALVEPLVEALMTCLAAVLEDEPALVRASLGPRVAAALARVGEAARPAALLLNPRDMAWARARLAAALADDGVALAADPAIPPGGFRLRAGAATVEDRIDERLGRLAAEARADLSEALVAAAGDPGSPPGGPPRAGGEAGSGAASDPAGPSSLPGPGPSGAAGDARRAA